MRRSRSTKKLPDPELELALKRQERNVVHSFVNVMLSKLDANEQKRRLGWRYTDASDLKGLLELEIEELDRALHLLEQRNGPRDRLDVILECADVALFALMIADRVRQR